MTREGGGPRWSLVLYVNGAAPRSLQAVESVRMVCDDQPDGKVDLMIVDVRLDPDIAVRNGVVTVPTLVRCCPAPVRRISGDLSHAAWVRGELGLQPFTAPAPGPPVGD